MILVRAAEQGRPCPEQEDLQVLQERSPSEAAKRKQVLHNWRSVVKVSASSSVDTRCAYYVLFTSISNHGSGELGTRFTNV